MRGREPRIVTPGWCGSVPVSVIPWTTAMPHHRSLVGAAQFLCRSYLGPQLFRTTKAWLVRLSSCVSHCVSHILNCSYTAPLRPGWCGSVPVSVIPWTTAMPHHQGMVGAAQFLCQSYLGPQLCRTTEAWLVRLSSCVSQCVSHILNCSYTAPLRPGWCGSVPVSVISWTTAMPHHQGLVGAAQFLCQSYLGPQLCRTTKAWLVRLSSCVSHILSHSYVGPGWCGLVPVSVIPTANTLCAAPLSQDMTDTGTEPHQPCLSGVA